MDAGYEYDELVLIEKFMDQRESLDVLIDTYERANAGIDTISITDKYTYLCKLQGLQPSPIFLRFLEEGSSDSEEGKNADSNSKGVLDFSRDYVGRLELLPMFCLFPECYHLRTLCLSGQRLTSGMVEMLCASLESLQSVEVLDLTDNPSCGTSGASALLRLVLRRPNIRECNINDWPVIAPVARRLQDALCRNRNGLTMAAATAA